MNSKKTIKFLTTLFLVWFIIHEIAITVDGLSDENDKKSFAVIFGTKVNIDGTLSKRLKARLDRGLKLYQDSLTTNIYVSGGLGKEGHYEGTKMAEYLILKGVPENHVFIDNLGNNTRLTSLNFEKDFPDVKSVIVVTQFFHVSRAKLAFEQIGLNDVTGAHANYFELRDIYSSFREFFGYYKYILLG